MPPLLFLVILQLVQFLRKTPGNAQDKKELLDKIDALRQESTAQRSEARESALQLQAEVRKDVQSSVNEAMSTFSRVFSENMKYSADAQALRIGEIGEMQNLRLAENNQKLESMRETVERRLAELQDDNNRKLDEMRGIVDEKLQKTISERMNESFRLVKRTSGTGLPADWGRCRRWRPVWGI